MALEQWVNLPKNEKFTKDGDGATLERCGKVTIEVMFLKDDVPISYKVKVTPVGSDNAVYTKKEMKRNPNFKMTRGTLGLSDKKNVLLEESIQLPAAGGNKYKIEAKDANGKVASTTMEIETRRKLYYQVVKMKDMKATISALTSHLEDEFWNSSKKHYIKLVKINSKGDISGFSNFDEHQQGQIPALTKKNYSPLKNPFCFVLVLVDQMAASERTDIETSSGIVNKGMPITVNTVKPIWLDLDKNGSPEAKWLYDAKFVEDGSGIEHDLKKHVSANGKYAVNIDSSALPDKAKGKIKLKIKLVNRFRTGLSLGKNAICVATRAGWKQRSDDGMKSTLVHEAGHKIGMVADGKDRSPAKQSTYYYKKGGHCNHGTNTCVMFGQIHAGRSNRFCSLCNKSVVKLDLDASQLSGFVPI